MLATLIAPTSGRARVAGLPLDAANGVEVRKRIAVMTENPGLYLRLTVAENLAFFAGLYELAEPEKRIGQALAAVNLAGRAERSLRQPLEGAPSARRARTRAAEQPGGRLPRRADLRSRPGRIPGRARADRRPPRARRHRLSHHSPARGSRTPLRPSRHPQHQPAHDRPAGRAARPALHEDAGRPYRRPARLAGHACSPSPESTAGAPTTRPATSCTVSDARIAAPAVTRALVAAGADLLSLAEAQHTLEDVYLELIADDPEADR